MEMTCKDAIEILEEVKTIDDSMFVYSQVYNDALDMAIEALKTQEPVGPKLGGNAGPFGTQWYQCDACSGKIDPNDKYCRHCGRALKWKQTI